MSRTGGEKTKERILNAATAKFAADGYLATSVRDIAAAAKVNLGLIPFYFGSKEKLYFAVCHRLFDGVAASLGVAFDGSGGDWRATVRAWIVRMAGLFSATHRPDVFAARVFRNEIVHPSRVSKLIHKEFFQPLCDQLCTCLRRVVDDEVEVCQLSFAIWSRVMAFALIDVSYRSAYCPPGLTHEEWVEAAASRIAADVIGGIEAKRHFHNIYKQIKGENK